MSTLFEKFIANPLPEEIYRYTPKSDATSGDGQIIAFMDKGPATNGHVLLVPEEPEADWDKLSPMRWQQLAGLSQIMSLWIKKRLPGIKRQGLLISGYGVPHTHVHILPSYKRGDVELVFNNERLTTPDASQLARSQEMPAVAATLSFASAEAQAIDLQAQTDKYLGDIAMAYAGLTLPNGLVTK